MATLVAKANTFFLCRLLRQPHTKKAKAQGEETPLTPSAGALTSVPSPGLKSAESLCELAKRLRPLLPQTCDWPPSDGIQVIDAAPFSSGSFAEVWKASVQGQIVVVKSLRCYSSPEFDPPEVGIRFLREVWASARLSHRNIVPFIGVCSTPTHPFALLYGMMDNLDLRRYLLACPKASRLKLLTEIAHALKYIHSLDITHGNIRVRNILVDGGGVACIGGLGSAFVPSLPASWSDVTAERWFCGIAPELINPCVFGFAHARTTKATDVFAFGMLAWEVFAGESPFSGNIGVMVVSSGLKNDRPLRPDHPEVSDRVWDMTQRCWEKNPPQRMSAADVADFLDAEGQSVPSHFSMALAASKQRLNIQSQPIDTLELD